MTHITLFSVPKPFEGRTDLIQRNAIASWSRLRPEVEVILAGREKGVAEAAAEFSLTHLPEISVNEFGTPLVDSLFCTVARYSDRPILCYVNADIILLQDFVKAVRRIPESEFLMIGQRWDWDTSDTVELSSPEAEEELIQTVKIRGNLHEPAGSDYFVFPRHLNWNLPPFAIGRPSWDNWLIYRARQMGVPVINATAVTTVIHQNHDYAHVPASRDGTWEGPEADYNRSLAGGWDRIFTLYHATHLLLPKRLGKAWGFKYLWRRFAVSRALVSKTDFCFRAARKALRPIKILARSRRRL